MKLYNLERVLDMAVDLYNKGSISKEVLEKLVNSAEARLNDEERFLAELRQWATDIMLLDDVSAHNQVMERALNSFLRSPDADDRNGRIEVLDLFLAIQKLFTAMDSYNQQQLVYALGKQNNT